MGQGNKDPATGRKVGLTDGGGAYDHQRRPGLQSREQTLSMEAQLTLAERLGQ